MIPTLKGNTLNAIYRAISPKPGKPFWNGHGDGAVEGIFHNPLADLTHLVLRFRNTAILIELILMAGRRSPHKLLDSFVKRSTYFSPTEGQKWCADEPELDDFGMEKLEVWNFDQLSAYLFLRI